MTKYIVLSTFVFLSNLFNAQEDYFDYHRSINSTEELIGQEKFADAVGGYDVIFKEYDYVFLKDLLIAAQVAYLSSDVEKTNEWLLRAVANGYECGCITVMPVFKEYVKTDGWIQIVSKSSGLHDEYLASIDLGLHYEFHHRYKQEQENKTTDRNFEIVYSNYKRIKSLMDSMPFPSERLIGIDNDTIFPTVRGGSLTNCSAGNSKIIPTLLHYDNPITDIGLDKFVDAVKLGHLHPNQFASIYTFETNYVSRLNNNRSINKPDLPEYYFNFSFGRKSNDFDRVDKDRSKFGISSLETDKNLMMVAEKYNVRFNYGYK